MRDIFSKHLEQADSMYAVQTGVLRALSEQDPPLGYLVGKLDLKNNQTDSKLAVYTRLLQRGLPVFSDIDVFNRSLVDHLQSYGQLMDEELIEYRRTVVNSGNISAVYLLPDWDKSLETYDVYTTAQAKGITFYMLDHRHPRLQF